MGTSDVPGCFGDADLIDDSSRDFCIRPLNLSTLVITGDSDTVTANSLGECQGDCDTGKGKRVAYVVPYPFLIFDF